MNYKNEILLATPRIKKDVILFTQSIVYLCQNDIMDGAMGLIINKPMIDHTLQDVFKELNISHSKTFGEILNTPLHLGGSIDPHKILVLHTIDDDKRYGSTVKLNKGLTITSSMDILKDLANNIIPEYFLPMIGYSCWSPKQLINEIKAGDWIVTDKINKKILFDYESKTQWQQHLRHIGYHSKNLNAIFNKAGNA